VEQVGYDAKTIERVSRWLSLRRPIPVKDCFGKAVYPYFFGVWAARHRYVLHLDSDMMFGGGSMTWIAEAKGVLAHPAVFTCSPLPGPPVRTPWPRHVAIRHAGSRRRRALSRNGAPFAAEGVEGPAFAFARFSTRTFMLDRSILNGAHGGVLLSRPRPRLLLGAASKRVLVRGNPLCAPAEVSLARTMAQRGLVRVDFLGSRPGIWSLHVPARSEEFYRALPEIIRRIEADDIPARQLGDYDLIPSLGDWTTGS
jgi:hypothetical protein